MGVYDRDYYREEPAGFFGGRRSAVLDLIIVNVALYLIDIFSDQWVTKHLTLRSNLFSSPWHAYQLLTYGFVHDYQSIGHILFNMIALFFFGRDVEGFYGRKRFLSMYLSTVVLVGLIWLIMAQFSAKESGVLGASGAIMGVIVLFVMRDPHRTIYVNFFIPVPAWLMLILYVGLDFFGIVSPNPEDHVAHIAHLTGVGLGFLYYRTGFSLAQLWPSNWSLKKLKRGPKLRVHNETSEAGDDPRAWQMQVDAILEKISQQGEASLTADERKILEEASRRYQQRRQ